MYTHEGLPQSIVNGFNKDDQSEAFAAFVTKYLPADFDASSSVKFGANFHRATDKGHWVEVIASIYKKGDSWDPEQEAVIRSRMLSE